MLIGKKYIDSLNLSVLPLTAIGKWYPSCLWAASISHLTTPLQIIDRSVQLQSARKLIIKKLFRADESAFPGNLEFEGLLGKAG